MKQPQSPSGPPRGFRIVFGVLKLICILGGLPLTVLCLMALVGLLSDNLWVRLVPAVLVALVPPIILVGYLLPEDDPTRGKGLPSDVLSLLWIAVPLLFVVAAPIGSGKVLAAEADRFAAVDQDLIGQVGYWLAGVEALPGKVDKAKPGTKKLPAAPVKPSKNPDKPLKINKKDAGSDATKGATKPDAAATSPDATKGATDAGGADPDQGRTKFSPAELFRRCAPSVVSIEVTKATGSGGGTGFVIDDSGTVATNSHVVHDATTVQVKLKDGTWLRRVDLLLDDTERDLALLRVYSHKKLKALPLGDSDAATVGEQVVSIGNPLGLDYTLTDGLVSARRVYGGKKWIQMSAPVSPGNSGGPLFNMYGEVIGVTTRVVVAWGLAQNLNLAVPVNDLKKRLKKNYPDRKPVGTDRPKTW